MGLIFNGNGDVIRAVDGSLTVEGIDLGGGTNVEAGIGTFSSLSVTGVLTYEDVKNVDSVGIVTARQGLRITGGGLDVVGISTFNNHIKLPDSDKAIFGTGEDLQIQHTGASSQINETTGELYINTNKLHARDWTSGNHYLQASVGAGVTAFFNGSKKFETTSTGIDVTGNIDVGDNAKIRLGNAEDLQLYHDGSSNYIDAHNGTLYIRGSGHVIAIQAVDGENLIRCAPNAEVKLYHDSSEKFQTTSTGIDVTGTAVADALNVTGTSVVATVKSTNNNYVMQLQGNNASDKVYFGTTSGNDFLLANGSGVTERLRIASDGKWTIKNVSGMALDLQSSAGTGNIWLEFSDTDGTRKGYLGYGSSGSEKVYWVQQKAANMSMYSNGSDRFEVQSDGTKIVKNGRLTINSTFIDFSGSISTPSTAAAIFRPADNTLAFSTANAERFRITSAGDFGINTTSPARKFEVNGTARVSGAFEAYPSSTSAISAGTFYNNSTGASADCRVQIKTYANQGADPYLHFDAGGSNFIAGMKYEGTTNNKFLIGPGDSPSGGVLGGLYIFGNGKIGMNSSSGSRRLNISDTSGVQIWTYGNCAGHFSMQNQSSTNSGTQYYQVFTRLDGSWDGYLVSSTDGQMTLANNSDYRLKENVVSMTNGIDIVKKLNPITYKWKASTGRDTSVTMQGFFAHEVDEAGVLGAVDGGKDAVWDTVENPEDAAVGSPRYQGLSLERLVPTLTAALKESIARIETLETRIAALESA